MADSGGQGGRARRADVLRLEAFLPYRLMMLAEQVSQSLARIYGRRHHLANPEWRVLAALGQHGRMTATEIGRHSRMHKTKVSRAVAELERRGLLVRTASDVDLRVLHLALTEAGRAVYDDIVPLAVTFAADLAADLSPEDAAALDRILATLMQRASAGEAAGGDAAS
jgi:DNA-binding MarR family transcriptional regulator